MPGNRDEERTNYWSLRDIPKFEGKGEQPFSHLREFEDYLIASGVRMEPDEDENGRTIDVDYRDIINKFKASLKNNARVWYSMYIDGRITDLYSEAGWKTIKSRFLTILQSNRKYQGTTNKSLERIEMETRRRETN